ncbi:MAG TPA: hypothetical protein VLH09_03750 [Bryobacteraceae bacterium]|nr:hypothetical protein [Bryobacteraceae bacterium]
MVFRSRGKTRLLRRWLLSLIPVSLFAAALALLQWAAGMPVTWLWLKTILVFVVTTTVVRLLPWDRWLFQVRRETWLCWLALYALIVRHFAWVLLAEGRRALTARALSAPNRHGGGWFDSLAHAVGALFSRALTRAERFYAAQLVRGVGE